MTVIYTHTHTHTLLHLSLALFVAIPIRTALLPVYPSLMSLTPSFPREALSTTARGGAPHLDSPPLTENNDYSYLIVSLGRLIRQTYTKGPTEMVLNTYSPSTSPSLKFVHGQSQLYGFHFSHLPGCPTESAEWPVISTSRGLGFHWRAAGAPGSKGWRVRLRPCSRARLGWNCVSLLSTLQSSPGLFPTSS